MTSSADLTMVRQFSGGLWANFSDQTPKTNQNEMDILHPTWTAVEHFFLEERILACQDLCALLTGQAAPTFAAGWVMTTSSVRYLHNNRWVHFKPGHIDPADLVEGKDSKGGLLVEDMGPISRLLDAELAVAGGRVGLRLTHIGNSRWRLVVVGESDSPPPWITGRVQPDPVIDPVIEAARTAGQILARDHCQYSLVAPLAPPNPPEQTTWKVEDKKRLLLKHRIYWCPLPLDSAEPEITCHQPIAARLCSFATGEIPS